MMAAMRLVAAAILVATTVAHADDWPADRNGRIAAQIAACSKDRAAVCLEVATELEHAGIASRLGYTPAKLRERATTLFEDQCSAGSADACWEHGRLLAKQDAARSATKIERGCTLGNGAACLYLAVR